MQLNIDYKRCITNLWYITIIGLIIFCLLYKLYILTIFFGIFLIIVVIACESIIYKINNQNIIQDPIMLYQNYN